MRFFRQHSKVQSNTPLLRNRSPQSEGHADSRPRQRAYLVHENGEELAQRFAGVGRGGNRQWPINLTRKIRRAIARDKMHREWNEGKRVVF